MSNNKVEILPTPEKSPLDKKDYRLIRLGSNGLQVLLVSSLGSISNQLAGISLEINVGGFQDYVFGVPGLAHFVEHMIFLGSKKYPVENEFEKYLTMYGGECNASTSIEDTRYYFSISEEGLEGSLDRFSRLFVEPLMMKDSINREREAVESEFQSSFNDDGVRVEALKFSLVKEGHPAKIFLCGNSTTLKDNITDNELYEKAHAFRKRFYVGNRSNLCIQSGRSLDELQELVLKHFSDFPYDPNTDAPLSENPEFSYDKIFTSEFHEKIYYVKPKQSDKVLYISWCIPSYLKKYRLKSVRYITGLLNYGGSGGLSSYLTKRLLATSVSSESEGSLIHTIFCTSITLTDYGLENIDQVLDAIFSYLLFLKKTGPSKEYFEDIQRLASNTFKFHEENEAVNNASELVENMRYCAPEDIISRDTLFFEYNEDEIKTIINFLNERKFNTIIVTDKYEKYDKQEKWYGTEYAEVDFPEKFLDLWNNRSLKDEFHLPKPNPFICSNFDIYYKEGDQIPKYPEKIISNDIIDCWYRLDDKFLLPKVLAQIKIATPMSTQPVYNYILADLYYDILMHYGKETRHQLNKAHHSLNLEPLQTGGFTIYITGYNEKFGMVLDIAVEMIKTLPSIMEESVFKSILGNSKKDNLETLRSDLSEILQKTVLTNDYISPYDIRAEYEKVTFEDVKEFAENWYKEAKIDVLVQGNILADEVKEILEKGLTKLVENPIDKKMIMEKRCRELPVGANYLRVKSLLPGDKNSVVLNHYQIEPYSLDVYRYKYMFQYLLTEPIFDQLRTQQQLGYSVSITDDTLNDYLAISIEVECQEYLNSAKYVDERIDEFLEEYVEVVFTYMSDDDLNVIKKMAIKVLGAPDTGLDVEFSRNWDEIENSRYMFDKLQKIIDGIGGMTKEGAIQFYEKYMKKTNQKKLSIQVVGQGDDTSNLISGSNDDDLVKLELLTDPVDGGNVIDDIEKFKNSLVLHPFIKIQ